ncbi:hypothetical protein [Pseudomonas sp. PWP3-1b2]|uniref:hypothetical protein n=1 Tax=Pseudomonas sp. PWP3-1b2 TaxID=2804656 RepID=UPI003CF25A0B
MSQPQSLRARLKKYLGWAVLIGLAALFIYAFANKPALPSEIVLKQDFIPGQSIYIVQDARNPDEPKSLRFYVNNGGGNDETMKVRLGKTPPFLVSDTDLKDVVIQRVANGLHITLKGAVMRYHSDLYLEDGDTYTTYRVSLEQLDTRPPLPSGR